MLDINDMMSEIVSELSHSVNEETTTIVKLAILCQSIQGSIIHIIDHSHEAVDKNTAYGRFFCMI